MNNINAEVKKERIRNIPISDLYSERCSVFCMKPNEVENKVAVKAKIKNLLLDFLPSEFTPIIKYIIITIPIMPIILIIDNFSCQNIAPKTALIIIGPDEVIIMLTVIGP